MPTSHYRFFLAVAVVMLVLYVGSAFAQAGSLMLVSQDAGVKGAQIPLRATASGSAIVSTAPLQCSGSSPHKFTSVGLTAVPVPTDAGVGRWYTRVCVTLEASGVPQVKCRTDGTAPAFGTTPGEVLSPGDCVTYSQPDTTTIQCISNAASTPVSTFECL